MAQRGVLFCALFWILIAVALMGLLALADKKPLFDNKILFDIVKRALVKKNDGSPVLSLTQMFENITKELQQAYPGHVTDTEPWIFNCAGGFKSGTKILHISITEYVIFWGTAVQTHGMSGRHFGDFHDFMMTGQFTRWKEGTYETKKFGPGEYIVHERWKGSVVALEEGTWMLEHFVGFLPWSLPFGLSDSLISNLDFLTVFRSLWACARLTLGELVHHGKV